MIDTPTPTPLAPVTVEPLPMTRMRQAGHDPVADGPTLGGAERWTCSRCGRAVLRVDNRYVYGSAKEFNCDGMRARL